jgi:hypothetical protein
MHAELASISEVNDELRDTVRRLEHANAALCDRLAKCACGLACEGGAAEATDVPAKEDRWAELPEAWRRTAGDVHEHALQELVRTHALSRDLTEDVRGALVEALAVETRQELAKGLKLFVESVTLRSGLRKEEGDAADDEAALITELCGKVRMLNASPSDLCTAISMHAMCFSRAAPLFKVPEERDTRPPRPLRQLHAKQAPVGTGIEPSEPNSTT